MMRVHRADSPRPLEKETLSLSAWPTGERGLQQQFTILESERTEDVRHPGRLFSTSTCFNLANGLVG